MNKIELKKRHEEELREFTDECVNGVVEKLPIGTRYDMFNRNFAMTIDECYALSNKFLTKNSLAYYLKCHEDVVITHRDCVSYFIECDENGRPLKKANVQKHIREKTGYMRLVDKDSDPWYRDYDQDTCYEEEEDQPLFFFFIHDQAMPGRTRLSGGSRVVYTTISQAISCTRLTTP